MNHFRKVLVASFLKLEYPSKVIYQRFKWLKSLNILHDSTYESYREYESYNLMLVHNLEPYQSNLVEFCYVNAIKTNRTRPNHRIHLTKF